MSSSNTSTDFITALNYSSVTFIRVCSYAMICLGTVGHLLSIYVFTRPILRSNPCARYFLASTITGIFVTYVNVPFRLVQAGYYTDVFGHSTGSCKILTFVLFWAKALASWFIALASVDRFLCSSRSVTVRGWSSLRTASHTILLVIPVVGLVYIYVPLQFKNMPHLPQKCPANQGDNPAFVSIWNLLIFSLGPSTIMLIFGSLTIRHVQQSVTRTVPQRPQNQAETQPQRQLQRQKKTNRHMIQMMLAQCIYFSLMSSPFSINWFYLVVRPNVVIDTLQLAKDTLFANIAGTLALSGACTSFYLFTLSSQLFRHELKRLFDRRWRWN